MATTTNFGWETPDDTDLVKDGALAMRTLGNSIDTSFVDLKGGTTGQNLRKNSNTDLDFTWAGDATNTVVDAAGDLLYGTANDTLGRLAIGTAGQVLKVNSGGTAPEWGAASSTPTFVGCSIYSNANQTIAHNTVTAIVFQVESYDSDAFHSTTTNTSRITIPTGKAGKYHFTGSISFERGFNGSSQIRLLKNGTMIAISAFNISATFVPHQINFTADAAVNDYFELAAYQDSGANKLVYTGSSETFFMADYLGA